MSAIAATAAVALIGCGSSAPRPTWMATTCGQPPLEQKPSTFGFSCDGNAGFPGVKWRDWGGSAASGSGTYMLAGDCIPDCASAPRYEYRARIVATEVAFCGHRRVYAVVTAYLDHRDFRGDRVVRGPRLVSCV
jgi:hypothetical protein